VRVAILDTGVNIQHREIKEAIKSTSIELDRCKGFPPSLNPTADKHGHGTFIASTLLKTAPDIFLYIARVANDTGKLVPDNEYEGVVNVRTCPSLQPAKCSRPSTGL